jgi:hypothetical protein
MQSFCFGAKPTIIHLTLTPKVGNLLYSPSHSLTHSLTQSTERPRFPLHSPSVAQLFRLQPSPRITRAGKQHPHKSQTGPPSKLCDDRPRLGENLRELVCRVIIRCHTTLEPPPPTSACPHLRTDEWPVSGDVRRPGLDTRYWRRWYSGTGPLGGLSAGKSEMIMSLAGPIADIWDIGLAVECKDV